LICAGRVVVDWRLEEVRYISWHVIRSEKGLGAENWINDGWDIIYL